LTNKYFESAKANGWWDESITWDMARNRLHEEVSEAFVTLGKGDTRDRFMEELADIYILCKSYSGGDKADLLKDEIDTNGDVDTLAFIHKKISGMRLDIGLEQITSLLIKKYGSELRLAIDKKAEKNKSRGYKHGRQF